jgi:hypothetical protein
MALPCAGICFDSDLAVKLFPSGSNKSQLACTLDNEPPVFKAETLILSVSPVLSWFESTFTSVIEIVLGTDTEKLPMFDFDSCSDDCAHDEFNDTFTEHASTDHCPSVFGIM